MTNNFAVQLKNTILQLASDPQDPLGFDIQVPYSLLSKTRVFFAESARSMENGDQIIRHEIHSESLVAIIRQVLAKLCSLGLNWESNTILVEESVRHAVKYAIENYPCHIAWSPVRTGIPHANDEIERIDNQVGLTSFSYISPLFELQYGIANALFCWSGEQWRITPLGDFFNTLSFPAGTVYLMLVEMYFSTPSARGPFEVNPWHMSREFLEAFHSKGAATVDIGQGEYSLLELDPNLDYINRLSSLGLTQTIDRTVERRTPVEEAGPKMFYFGDDFYETCLTEYGKEVISECLHQQDSLLSVFVNSLISFELSGSNYFNFKDPQNIDRLLNYAEKATEVTGDQMDVMNQIVSHLKSGSSPIILLRAIPPTIEAVLRNILVHHGKISDSEASRLTLNPICKKYDALIRDETLILQKDTVRYVSSLSRNDLLHGNISPNDQCAAALVDLMCNVLMKIYQDYAVWKSGQR